MLFGQRVVGKFDGFSIFNDVSHPGRMQLTVSSSSVRGSERERCHTSVRIPKERNQFENETLDTMHESFN